MDLNDFFQQNKLPVYAADMQGESLSALNVSSPIVIVMGSESNGVSPLTKEHVTRYLTIPQFGSAESLNVGIATGIIAGYLRMSL